jgi:hypothetical protein
VWCFWLGSVRKAYCVPVKVSFYLVAPGSCWSNRLTALDRDIFLAHPGSPLVTKLCETLSKLLNQLHEAESFWRAPQLVKKFPAFPHSQQPATSLCPEPVRASPCLPSPPLQTTRTEIRFLVSAKQTSPFKSAGASVKSTAGSRGVRFSGSNAGYTMFRGNVKSTGYPLHWPVSPSLPLPFVSVCHHISPGLYNTPSTAMSSKWSISFKLPHQNPICHLSSSLYVLHTPLI